MDTARWEHRNKAGLHSRHTSVQDFFETVNRLSGDIQPLAA